MNRNRVTRMALRERERERESSNLENERGEANG